MNVSICTYASAHTHTYTCKSTFVNTHHLEREFLHFSDSEISAAIVSSLWLLLMMWSVCESLLFILVFQGYRIVKTYAIVKYQDANFLGKCTVSFLHLIKALGSAICFF